MLIGLLGFQGAIEEHELILSSLGADSIRVKKASELIALDGLIFPGGESTTMLKMLEFSNLLNPLQSVLSQGLPVMATCAGLILLAKKTTSPVQKSLGQLDITVKRNGYGPQYFSFCEEVSIESFEKTFRAVFIRAPIILSTGPSVHVMARDHHGHPVFVRSGRQFGMTFHPELTQDDRIHRLFLNQIKKNSRRELCQDIQNGIT
ncbi:pyridoxal 5'-phosphate synthase glutaminase subunit PdxT [bacterium]|nr:pyridoxal 5'-phosphate synthase glutaminase subunit PdxT [bacterium]